MMDRITWSNVLSTWKNVGVSTNQDTRSQTLLTITMESTVRNQKVNSSVSSHPSILSLHFPWVFLLLFRVTVTLPHSGVSLLVPLSTVSKSIPDFWWHKLSPYEYQYLSWEIFLFPKSSLFLFYWISSRDVERFQWGQPEMRNIFTSPK